MITWFKKNKLLVFLVITFLFLNNLPYLAGIYRANISDKIFTAAPAYNYDDYFVYLSNIESAAQDNLFSKNYYSHTSELNLFFSPHWFLLGQFSKVANLGTIASYHVFRIIFSLFFIAVLWWWLKKIFDTYKKQLLALAMVLFANGLGVLFLSFWPNSNISPVNLWVAESNTFYSLYYSPLFILSQTLILLIAAIFIRATAGKNKKLLWLAGLLTLTLGIIHPYDLLIIIPIITFWLIISPNFYKKKIFYLAPIYLAGALASAYFYWLLQTDPSASAWNQQNIVSSGNILSYIWGFGLITILWLISFFIIIKKAWYKNIYILFLLLWGSLGWILVYLPVNFNRRLSNGWHIPLVILSIVAIKYIYKKLPPILKGGLIMTISILLIFDTLYYIISNTQIVYNNQLLYIDQARESIYELVKNTPADSAILTRGIEGNRLPAFSARKVYLGHSMQTWQPEIKNKEVIELWTSQRDISTWLNSKGIDYIFASKEYIPEFYDIKWLATENYIEPIVDNDDFIFYEVKN